MARNPNNLRSSVAAPAAPEADLGVEPGSAEEAAELAEDPYYYGWRYRYETLPDGTEKLRQVPLTYADLLDPQEEDFIAENTVHRKMVADLVSLLQNRFADDPTVAVWSDLKILFEIPGLTTGPGPDVCVVKGVEDRDRLRRSFRYGEEPGKVVLVIEVVSSSSAAKDYRDILEIYSRLEVEEYVTIRPLGDYDTGPFELRAWRRDDDAGRLVPIDVDAAGRYLVRTCGLLFGTGEEGWGLEIRDAETGERLRPVEEALRARVRVAEERRERAEDKTERLEEELELVEAKRRRAEAKRKRAERRAESERERAEREAEARRRAEAELARLRAELGRKEF